jgi:4-amino-4-deoxy-L-arabinose transferase-like glycosyltransferase
VLTAYFVLRVLRGNERSWIGVGIVVGLGMMTKYSMAFLVAAMVLAIVILPERSVFLSRYFLAALAIALCIFLPNLVWLARNDFITYDFLAHIHARDIAWGRTEGFFLDQLSDCLGLAPCRSRSPVLSLSLALAICDGFARRWSGSWRQ